MKNKKIIVSVGVCVLIAVVSFWGGVNYGKSKSGLSSFVKGQGSFNQNGTNSQGGRMMGQNIRGGSNGGGFTSGEVISMDATSMTIKLRDGGSKIVLFSPASKVEKTVDGAISDVAVGKSVMVTGTTNPDGSVSATSIQMRPTLAIPAPAKTN
jgi:hypothetical protein